MLRLESISKSFARSDGTRLRVLDNFSATVDIGEILSVRAPEHSGKTTLCLVAGGLVAPDSGRVLLDAIDIQQLPKANRSEFIANNVGFLFQRLNLIPSISAMDNILLPSLTIPIEHPEPLARELAVSLEFEDELQKRPTEMNLDNRVKTALARALLHRPRLLVADDSNWNVSTHAAYLISKTLREHAGQGNIVLTTSTAWREPVSDKWHVSKHKQPLKTH